MKSEQLPIPEHKLHGWTHFAGLYAGEHVAATEFVIGATFVALGATTKDILIGLLIGNVLAVLSWTLITAPIAVQTRLSLYTYLDKIAGDSMTKLYNWANVLIFTVISAAMITVSSTAVRLLITDDGLLPTDEDGNIMAGDIRAAENLGLTAMQTLFLREHNRVADEISAADPDLSDEEISQQAREIVIAELQSITYNEFLPALLGEDALSEYQRYDSSVDPSIANEYSTAAFRFGHSTLNDGFGFFDNDGLVAEESISLADAFFNPSLLEDYGIDTLLKASASHLWVGLMAEDHAEGSSLGETSTTIIADQFERLRDGDRFYYENSMTDSQIRAIENTTLADIIEMNTNNTNLQSNIFFFTPTISGTVTSDTVGTDTVGAVALNAAAFSASQSAGNQRGNDRHSDGRDRNSDNDWNTTNGVEGIAVELVNSDGDGVDTAFTDSEGNYEFASISTSGQYQVRVAANDAFTTVGSDTIDVLISSGDSHLEDIDFELTA